MVRIRVPRLLTVLHMQCIEIEGVLQKGVRPGELGGANFLPYVFEER